MESTNNISFIPLQAGRAYIGTYDTVSSYASAVISLFADTDCEIFMYQSQNKTGTYLNTYNSTGGTQFTQNVPLSAPYVYFVVRNTTGTNQTSLSFTVIYKTAYAQSSVGSAVSIVSQSAGLALDSSLFTINNTLKGKGNYTLWNSVSVENGDTSAIASSVYATRVLSIFGNASDTATLTLQLSIDGSTFYSTQSTITVNGDFGFSIPCSFLSFRLIASGISTTSTISAFSTYS